MEENKEGRVNAARVLIGSKKKVTEEGESYVQTTTSVRVSHDGECPLWVWISVAIVGLFSGNAREKAR